MPIKPPKDPIEITPEQADTLISKVKNNDLDKADQRVLCQLIIMFLWLQYALRETRISLKKIKKLVFGQKSEKQNRKASGNTAGSGDDNKSPNDKALSDNNNKASDSSETSTRTGGGGCLGKDAYTGAETIHCPHPEHESGDICPECKKGSLFKMKDPGTEIRLFSQGLIQAIIYFLERYRCSAILSLFSRKNVIMRLMPLEKYIIMKHKLKSRDSMLSNDLNFTRNTAVR